MFGGVQHGIFEPIRDQSLIIRSTVLLPSAFIQTVITQLRNTTTPLISVPHTVYYGLLSGSLAGPGKAQSTETA